jgi:hypothetical protein
MGWRADERASIESFAAELSRERGIPFTLAEGADPPDALCKDPASDTIVAIEHTRVEPRDLASEDRWQQFFKALEAVPMDALPGTFLLGPRISISDSRPRSGSHSGRRLKKS